MKINEKIIDILREFKIPIDDGICYLIAVHHGYEPSYIPGELKLKINQTKIVTPSAGNVGVNWTLPLYDGGVTAFDWVKTEYVPLFKEKNKDRAGHAPDATRRLKKLFAKDPSIRKEEVMQATKNYLASTDADYIRFPHYFVEKGKGAEKTSDLLSWIESLREEKEYQQSRSSSATTMQ